MAPQVLVGLNDVRHKIGTDVEFYVKGKTINKISFYCNPVESRQIARLTVDSDLSLPPFPFPRNLFDP